MLIAPEDAKQAVEDALGAHLSQMLFCVQKWAIDGGEGFDGSFQLHLELGPGGLDDARIFDVEDVPESVTRCFGELLWSEVDWPAFERTAYDMPWTMSIESDDEEP